jgi:hypothetical protein
MRSEGKSLRFFLPIPSIFRTLLFISPSILTKINKKSG